jgi:hypothetical protein
MKESTYNDSYDMKVWVQIYNMRIIMQLNINKNVLKTPQFQLFNNNKFFLFMF